MSRRRRTPLAAKDIDCPQCSIHLMRLVVWPHPRNVKQFGRRNTSTFVASDGNSYQLTFEGQYGSPVMGDYQGHRRFRGVRAKCPRCDYDLIINKRSVYELAEHVVNGDASGP